MAFSASLPALPKLDKNQFILDFIRAQNAHAKEYAKQGRSLSDIQTTPQNPPPTMSASRHLFSNNEHRTRSSQSRQPPKPEKPSNIKSKKRAGPESEHDEDQAARLVERRERKRVKRAIVQPKEPSESETASETGNLKSKKRTKVKGKKPKVPSAFALMHGFSATNVGKNRLTLKPPSNVGVFKKGKASFKAKVNSKPKGHKIRHFSELGFLNNTKKAAEKDASMSSSESSATSAQEIPASKKKAPTREARQTPAVARPASDLSKNPDSDIWDMESRASEKKRLRKQKLRSVEETSAIHVHGTVIVDARMPAWSERVAKAANVDPAETPDPVIPSSPSLGPSQSASQFKPLPVQAASRYFPSAEQTPAKRSTPPPLPVKSVSSIEAEHEPLQSDQDLEPQPQHTLVPPTCFAVPTRNRVLANQFPSVQAVPQDCILYPSAMIQVVLPEDPNHYAPSLQTSQSDFYPDELSMPQYSEEEEPLDVTTQLGCYVEGNWNIMATAAFDNDYEDEEFLAPCEEASADAEYMDVIGGLDYAESLYDQYEAGPFMDTGDELGSNGWEEPAADAVYLADSGYDALAADYGYDLGAMEEDGNEDAGSGEEPMAYVDTTSEGSDVASAFDARFTQGRALLLGLPIYEPVGRGQPAPHSSNAEVDVAKALRGHWLPQKL